jgi:Cd2+/Zn2+-exporting ATPase
MTDAQRPLRLIVQGLDCPDCAASLEKAVAALPIVEQATLNYALSRLDVVAADEAAVIPEARRLAREMGFDITVEGATEAEAPRPWWKAHAHLLRTGAAMALALAGLLLSRVTAAAWPGPVAYGAAIVVAGYSVARAAWGAWRNAHTLDMNALMTIAAVGAMLVGEYAEGAVTMILFAIGEALESYSSARARNAVRALMALTPDEATRLGETQETVPVAALRLGDRILVRPGERVPMDGRILEGQSSLDQAPITGESMPVERTVGEEVYAGSINGRGALILEVTHLAADNTLARMMRLVEEAQTQRAPTQRFVDRFARIYTPSVMALALLVALVPPLLGLGPLSTWFYRALVLLVIACPCALVISTPVTIVSSLARAAKAGVLVKGGRYLEELARVRAVAFDKTGTLTEGHPRVVSMGCERHGEGVFCDQCDDLLAKAAAVEQRSEHSLAQAVLSFALERGVLERYAAGDGVEAVVGRGVLGTVQGHAISVGSHAFCHRDGRGDNDLCYKVEQAEREGYTVLVAEDDCCDSRCYLAVADEPRHGAALALGDLRHAGVEHLVMLTGDNRAVAERLAGELGLDDVRAELLPQDKLAAVDELERVYGHVAMVGDGVNDAPALARASVGIAMGAAGTDAALETADVALMGDDLSRLSFALRLSRRMMAVVRANIALALLIKALFLILAVSGVATLWMAVVADTGASLLVTLNGMRMLGFERRVGRGA